MGTRYRDVVDTDSGIGQLFSGSEFIGEVEYRYQIAQEYLSLQTLTRTEVVPGLQNLHGSFSTKSTIDLLGKELRLITAKAKELQITIMAGDPIVKIYIFIFGQSGHA